MKLARCIAAVVLCLSVIALGEPVAILGATASGHGSVIVNLRNPGAGEAEFAVPAGTIVQTAAGRRAVVLRGSRTKLPPGAAADLEIPAAQLASAAGTGVAEIAELSSQTEPRLRPLLEYLEKHADVPRSTSQCAVFALLEDITFAQWRQWSVAGATAGAIAPEQASEYLAEALDAAALLREMAPDRKFRLQQDEELKLRSLRQPGLRGKAMLLFGMSVPMEGSAVAPVAPNLGQLLHTKPGDDCPICRMRSQMQRGAGDL